MYARSKRSLLFVCAVLACLAIVGAWAAGSGRGSSSPHGPALYAPHVPGEVLIKLKPSAGPNEHASVRAQVAAQKLKRFQSGAEHWKLGAGRTVEQAIAVLRGNPNVEYVEPNYIVQSELAPNDARYHELWGMNNTGQTGGTSGADIDAERAWSISTGSHDVVVAVIDTGFDRNHPDLAANAWTNPGEIAGNNIDDDQNGFVDDVHGWDFVNNDNDPMDDNGHGTHCSGTIGAVGNNGIGVAGVNWNVSIVGVKFLSAGGSGSTDGAISAIEYATSLGVDVMSNSWGGGGFSQALLDAIRAAAAQEIVFVAAAGNDNSNNDVSPHYPSSYDSPNVIAVAATDHNDAKASFSSYGATTVDLGAPGVDILSTLPGNAYGLLSGTSMATPHVSGAAALLRAVAPNTSAALVRQILMNFADDVPSMQGRTVSGGRLNAFFPIAEPDDVPPAAIVDLATTGATSNSLFVGWTATGDDGTTGTAAENDLRYSLAPIDDASFASATRVIGLPVPGPSGTPQSTEVLGLTAGTQYYFAIKAKDEWGNSGPLSNVAIGTTLPPPTFASSPASFSASLFTGQTTTRTLTIDNVGVGTLDWRIPLPSVSGPIVVQHQPIELGKLEPDPRPGIPALEGFGGPDSFGYRWMDSDEPGGPTFSWTDIGASGTPIAGLDGDDQNAGPIPIGFNFSFYGTTFDSVRVSTNGWISFTSTASTGSTVYSNQPLPSSGGPENLIAGFWDDLHFRGALRARYANVGGNFVIQFTEVDTYATGSSLTFQIELRPSGEIRLRYLHMAGTLTSATIGIQNATKTDGLTVAFNAPYVHDDLEVRLAAVPQWLTAAPTSGRLFGADPPANVSLTIDATGLDGGTYEGVVNVQTNDPLQPVVGHPVTLQVTGAPAIAVAPSALDFGQVYLGFSSTLALSIDNTGTDTLTVTSIASGNPQITLSSSSLVIPAHSGATVNATYTPTAAGALSTSLTIDSDASNTPHATVGVTGSAAPAPAILVDPSSFSETLFTGGTVARNLRVRNTGGSNLNVNLAVDLGVAVQPPIEEQTERPKGDESEAGTGDNVIDRTGGPDAFGYRFADSDSPGGPTFNWFDISSIGTPITFGSFDDSNAGPIPIGFSFPFYGNNFTTIRACTNGFLSFTSTATSTGNPATLPTGGTTLPNNLIAPLWDDLHFRSVQRARYYNDGTRFIVQYTDVDRFSTSELPSPAHLTFQVILYPSGKIVFQYLTVTGFLTSNTIGIQNATRDIGLRVSANEAYLHNNLAIEIGRVPSWLEVSPTTATIAPGAFRDFAVTFSAGDSGNRTFNGTIRVNTNIPSPPFVNVPATLHVLGVPDVATDPTSVAFGTRFVGYPHLDQLAVRNVGTETLTVSSVTSNDPHLFVEAPPGANAVFLIPPGQQVLFNLRWLPDAPAALAAAVTIVSDDPDEGSVAVPVTGTAILPPILGYSPASFSKQLFAGQSDASEQVVLTNSGASDLQFTIGVRLTDALVVPVEPQAPLGKGQEPQAYGVPRVENAGGPDMFGYHWKDSDEPGGPTFDWFDISAIGTPIAGLDGDDELSSPISLGFSFPFYGNPFSTVRVSTNGRLSFTSTVATGSFSYDNQALPTGGTSYPENTVAPFWDDLHFRSAERARTFSDGTRFIVQYTNVDRLTTGSSLTFQVVLYPSGRIVYQYLSLSGVLNSATIGIQNGTRDDGLTVAFNQAYVHDHLAVEFRTIADWLTVGQSSGTIPPGGSVSIPVTFDATDLVGGTYHGGLRVLTNDPANALVEIPATLDVTGYPAIAAAPASIDYGTVFVGVSSTVPVQVSNPGTDVLHVTNVAVTGDYSTDTTPFSLAVGASRTLNVVFAPSTSGARSGSLVLTSDATGTPALTVALTGNGLYPPIAGVDPTSFTVALPPAGNTTRTLALCNTGGSDLQWTAGANLQAAVVDPYPLAPDVEAPKGDDSDRGTGVGIERSGGPDAFGYRFRDSDEPNGPAFDWVDISSTGTPIAGLDGDDELSSPIALGFTFPFYGNSFTTVRVSTNGRLSFTSAVESGTFSYNNQALPTGGTSYPENLLAPFWDDLHFRSAEHARTFSDGSRFIVQYTAVDRFTTGSSLTFQVILYPTGRIVYQYLTLTGVLDSSTVGIQNGDRTIGLTANFNASYLHDGMAIEFYKIADWLQVSPASGSLAAGACVNLTLSLSAVGLEDGDYDGAVEFLTNDPFHATFSVPVALHVGEVELTYFDVDPNTINFDASGHTIRAAIQLPAGLDPHDIVISSVSLFGQLFANPSPIAYADDNHDGILELVVKFDRAAFEALVPTGDQVPITVTGEVRDQTWFTGTTYVRTIHPHVTAPNGGEYLVAGASTALRWNSPPNGSPSSYDVWLSRDGGLSWESVATQVTGTSYSWTVGGAGTDHARIRVDARDSRGVMGYDTSDADFTIAGVLHAPAPATNLVLSRESGQVVLRWKQPLVDALHGPATSFRIVAANSAQGPFVDIGTTTGLELIEPAHGLGTDRVFYRIVAVNAAGASE
jgi:subtilisin family serine protease